VLETQLGEGLVVDLPPFVGSFAVAFVGGAITSVEVRIAVVSESLDGWLRLLVATLFKDTERLYAARGRAPILPAAAAGAGAGRRARGGDVCGTSLVAMGSV
jgi:hypothetical protein